MIQEVYDGGHRHFGENYVQEFLEKAPQVLPNLFPNPLFFHGSAGQTPNLSSIFFLAMDHHHHHHQEPLLGFTWILGA
jgi:hypothetical protein